MVLCGVVQVTVMIVAATILALLLETASPKWPGFFRATYFLPYGIPGVIATILWSFLYIPGLSPVVDVLQLVGINIDFLGPDMVLRSEEHTSELQSRGHLVCRLLLEKKNE